MTREAGRPTKPPRFAFVPDLDLDLDPDPDPDPDPDLDPDH